MKSSSVAECISFYCQTIYQRKNKIETKQLTLWCRQQQPFINTLMTEIVFFTQYALRHNEFRATNWNIFSLVKHSHLNTHWFVTWCVDTLWWDSSEPSYLTFQIINNTQRKGKKNIFCKEIFPLLNMLAAWAMYKCMYNQIIDISLVNPSPPK